MKSIPFGHYWSLLRYFNLHGSVGASKTALFQVYVRDRKVYRKRSNRALGLYSFRKWSEFKDHLQSLHNGGLSRKSGVVVFQLPVIIGEWCSTRLFTVVVEALHTKRLRKEESRRPP